MSFDKIFEYAVSIGCKAEREVPMSMFDITKNGVGSNIVVGYNKEV